jgi:hypothetical protein
MFADEKRIMGRFFNELSKDTGLAGYGEQQVLEAIKMGAVDTVLLSETLSDEKIVEYENAAQPMGSEVKIISDRNTRGCPVERDGQGRSNPSVSHCDIETVTLPFFLEQCISRAMYIKSNVYQEQCISIQAFSYGIRRKNLDPSINAYRVVRAIRVL